MNPLARTILDLIAELDERTLFDCYGIKRTDSDNAPLDLAILAWRDAGCPMHHGDEQVEAMLVAEAHPLFHTYRVAEVTVFCFGRTDAQVDVVMERISDRVISDDCCTFTFCETRWAEPEEAAELEGEVDED